MIEAIDNGADFCIQKGGHPETQFAELSHKTRQAVKRKQAEEALILSKKRFRSMAERSSDLILILD